MSVAKALAEVQLGGQSGVAKVREVENADAVVRLT
jgi:hypothetical protein